MRCLQWKVGDGKNRCSQIPPMPVNQRLLFPPDFLDHVVSEEFLAAKYNADVKEIIF